MKCRVPLRRARKLEIVTQRILIWEGFFLKGFDVPLEGAFIHVITLGLMFDSNFTFLGGELEGKSIKTLDTNFV